MRKLYILVAVAILLGVGAYFGSPYWTIHQIRNAAEAGQGDRLADYVDFPAVRESVKTQLAASMQKDLNGPKMKNNPFAALGQSLAVGLVNTMVDAMITPDGIANMIRSGHVARTAAPSAAATSAAPAPTAPAEPDNRPKLRQGYEGMNIFKAALLDPKTGEDLMEAVLSRQGMFAWRLTAISIPGLLKK